MRVVRSELVDGEMVDVPADSETLGEIVMRGNDVMKGHHLDPEATTAAFAGGWFHSGDLGVMHPDGYIELRGMAGQTLVLFMLPLLLALLLVLPRASATSVGAGLVVLAVVAGVALVLIGDGKDPAGLGPQDRLARLLDKVSPSLLVTLLTLVGGCLQLAGADGLYWVALSAALSLVGGVVNAWLFLTR